MSTALVAVKNEPTQEPVRADRLKVLYIIDELREMGGAERVLLSWIRNLPRDRFASSLVTFRFDPQLPGLDNLPCAVKVWPLRRTYDWQAFSVARRLAGLIRRERIDIVHTLFETSDLWASVVAWLAARPVLISSRRDMGILRKPKHQVAYRLVGRLYDQVQAVSEQVRQFCIRQDGLPADKVITLPNGISLERFDRTCTREVARAALGWDASPLIATVAHIRRVKGVDVFLRAAARIRERYPQAGFLIVGENHEPEHYRQLEVMVEKLDLARHVRFLGGREDIPLVLQACDAFCLLSRNEGMANAVLEAMACGLPCVVTGVGGNPELVQPERNGWVVPSEDDGAAAEAVLKLLDDPAMAVQMGRAGREIVESRYSLASMMNRLTTEYERLHRRRLRLA